MGLGDHAIRSTLWFGSTKIIIQVVSWAATMVIARLLSPSDYGLFGMALSVIALLQMVQELGLGTAIIQKKDLTSEQVSGVFWVILGLCSLLFVVGYFASIPAAAYYGEPKLEIIIQSLSAVFLINALGMVPYSLLTRKIDFKHRSLSDVYGNVVSIAATLSLANWGYGVWALVIGNIAQSLIRNGAMLVYSGWKPKLVANFDGIGKMLAFGLTVMGSSLAGRLYTVANPMIIGKILGAGPLGFFTMADSIGSNNPANKISITIINQLSLPVFSKLQDSMEELRVYFLTITRYLALLGIPLQIGTALIAQDLVIVLLTEKWIGAVELIQFFSITGLFYVIPLPCGPLLTARGKAGLTLRLSTISSVILVVAIFIGAHYGLRGIAVSWAVCFPITRLILVVAALGELKLPWKNYFGSLFCPVAASIIMVDCILISRMHLYADSEPFPRMIGDISIGAVSYIAFCFLFDKRLLNDFKTGLSAVFQRKLAKDL